MLRKAIHEAVHEAIERELPNLIRIELRSRIAAELDWLFRFDQETRDMLLVSVAALLPRPDKVIDEWFRDIKEELDSREEVLEAVADIVEKRLMNRLLGNNKESEDDGKADNHNDVQRGVDDDPGGQSSDSARSVVSGVSDDGHPVAGDCGDTASGTVGAFDKDAFSDIRDIRDTPFL